MSIEKATLYKRHITGGCGGGPTHQTLLVIRSSKTRLGQTTHAEIGRGVEGNPPLTPTHRCDEDSSGGVKKGRLQSNTGRGEGKVGVRLELRAGRRSG